MHLREAIVDIFSTFLQFEGDSFSGWATDPRLRRSMQQRLAQFADAEPVERFWVLYWHKYWLKTVEAAKGTDTQVEATLPLGHLSAYLQETCYWSVQRTMAHSQSPQTRLSDCFQVAIVEVAKILRVYDPDQTASLKTYASIAFANVIRNYLRQRREVDLCNDWGLLLKVSRKQLSEALHAGGLTSEQIDRSLLAWSCFNDLHTPNQTPGVRKLAAPDATTWAAIATAYNQQQQQLAVPGSACSPETLERWLLTCAKQVRQYLYPAIASLNVSRSGQTNHEWQDELLDPGQESLLTDLIAQEEDQQRQAQSLQVNQVLVEALAQLKPEAQTLLQRYYQAGLTQQQIAQELGLRQYQVSRQLTRAREALLLTFTQWSQNTLHISLTSDVVKSITLVLEEWLQAHYQGSHLSGKEHL